MATALRLPTSTSKSVILETVKSRRLGGVTPKSVRGGASAFHIDTTPKSNVNCCSPTSGFFTPRTPSTNANQFRSVTMDVFPPMKVKNMFIDGYDDVGTDGGNTGYGRGVQSEPASMFRNAAFPLPPAQPEMRTVYNQQPSQPTMHMAQPIAQPTMWMAPTVIMGGQSMMMGAQPVMGPAAAAQRLSVAMAGVGQDGIMEQRSAVVTISTVGMPLSSEGYPRLLGRAPATQAPPSGATLIVQRQVHFSDEPRQVAQSARATCLAMQERVASRRLPQHAFE